MGKHISIGGAFLVVALALVIGLVGFGTDTGRITTRDAVTSVEPGDSHQDGTRTISDVIKSGESFFQIFKRYGLDTAELFEISRASAKSHSLRQLAAGRPYSLRVDMANRVQALTYQIDGLSMLNITRTTDGFQSAKVPIEYERTTANLGGVIKENLSSSLGNNYIAMELSDIFAWDIDFMTDIRSGDTYRAVIEVFRRNGEFVMYGDILAAEFVNNGRTYTAYRYVRPGASDAQAEYFDAEGRSLRRPFLKAPLSYRRISSGFSYGRLHPVLKIYRPHLGIDYAAAKGTPVSAVGDGTVEFAGYKGQNGNMVEIKHAGGYRTYYGHLHKIGSGIRRGARVAQGQVIGTVGATGLATGPHLDYRVKRNGVSINPLDMKMPKGVPLNPEEMNEFATGRVELDDWLAAIWIPQENP